MSFVDWDWEMVADLDTEDLHLIPIRDSNFHVPSRMCDCLPLIDSSDMLSELGVEPDSVLLIHHPFDGRDLKNRIKHIRKRGEIE